MEFTPKTLAKQIVENLTYQSKRQPGAILLNGGWGVGKTHLWREEILPLLKEKGQLCVYVSLFGVKSVDDLKGKLTTALVGDKGVEKAQWTEQFVKALPGAFMTAVSGIAKEKLGLDASDPNPKIGAKAPKRPAPSGFFYE